MTLAMFWQASFAVIAGGLFVLPFLPAWRARHAEPAPDQDGGMTDPSEHDWLAPADSMRDRVQAEFGHLLSTGREHGITRGIDSSGAPFLLLGIKDHLAEQLPPGARHLGEWVLSSRHIDVPGEMVCEQPLYALARVNLAHDAVVRCVFAEREVVIGTRARVMRWAHAELRLDAAEGAVLYGCASAGREISLARKVRFERLHAPRICFGRPAAPVGAAPTVREPLARPEHVTVEGGRWFIRGDFHVPDDSEVTADLVVSGHVTVGANSRIHGSVRAGRSLVLAEWARITGSAWAEGSIHLTRNSQVRGPVVTLRSLRLDAGSLLGQPEQPVTAIARRLRATEGATAFGAIWAQQGGEVWPEARA